MTRSLVPATILGWKQEMIKELIEWGDTYAY